MLGSPAIYWTHYILLFYFIFMADVFAIDLWQCDVIGRCYSHDAISLQLMFFVFLADVVAMLLCWMVMFYHQADVIALLADVIANLWFDVDFSYC